MSNVPTIQTTGGAVANPDDDNPYAAYGEQATGGARNIVKFRKGRYFYSQDDIEIPVGTRLIADMAGAKVGWVRWWDGRPTDEVMVLIADNDRGQWETDDRGDPKDPWQFTNHLPLKGPETGDEFLFATSTRGGIGAIGAFAKTCGTLYRQKPGKLPVVELQASDYAHPNKAYGRVDVAVFELVDWVAEVDLLSGEAGDQAGEEPTSESEGTTGGANSANRPGAGRRTRF